MLEKDVEKYLVDRIKKLGGIAYKFTSPARRSVPDRLIILPRKPVEFAECKRPGGDLTVKQKLQIELLRSLGVTVHVIDTKEKVDALYPA